MTSFISRSRISFALGTAVLLFACGKRDAASDSTTATPPAAAQATTSIAAVQRGILAETAHYQFSADMAPEVIPDSLLSKGTDSVPAMKYAYATLRDTTPHVAGNRIIGRITSAGPWPRLGIVSGTNYVWRDSSAAGVRILILPVADGKLYWWDAKRGDYGRTWTHPFALVTCKACLPGACTNCTEPHCTSQGVKGEFAVTDQIGGIHP